MAGFKSAAKRKRELAKLDKRHAKDQKRAVRKAERSANGGAAAPSTAGAVPLLAKHQPASGAASAGKPTTFAEAVELWKRTKIAKPTKR